MQKLAKLLAIAVLILAMPAKALEVVSDIPEKPTSALIMMHGYSGNGPSLRWLGDNLKTDFPAMAFYYPTAPDKAPHNGYQWFVLPALGEEITQKEGYEMMLADALRNVTEINNLITEIHNKEHIPYQNIYVAGFSQGGMMAVLTALTNRNKIGKAVSFSGVPVLQTSKLAEKLALEITTKVLLIQGDNDTVIPADSYKMTEETLKKINIPYEIRIMKGMNHRISHETFPHVIKFLH